MIKFGASIQPQHPRSESAVKRFQESVELTHLLRNAGFDSISCGHHYLAPPYQSPQLVPTMARLVPESSDMRIVLGILLLPLYSPADVAETVATLDIISGGRVVFGVGLGYRDIEYEAFNVDRQHRVSRFLESLELVKRLWTEDDITFEGKHFRLTGGTSTVRPIQKPYPPIWIAANNDGMVRRAGRLGHPWFLNPHATLTTLERQMGIYREGLEQGGNPMPGELPIIKELHVARTHEEAVRVAGPYMESKYRSYADWGQDRVLPGEEDFRVSFEELARDRFVVGSVEEVIQQIEEHHQRLGANHFIFRVHWPGMEAYHAYRVVELMGDHVLPYFRRKYP